MTAIGDQIFGQKVKVQKLDMSGEWDGVGDVYVRKLDGVRLAKMQTDLENFGESGSTNGQIHPLPMARIVVLLLCDADGASVFADEEAEQLASVLSFKALNEICNAGIDFNGVTEAALEESAKNSEAVPAASLG